MQEKIHLLSNYLGDNILFTNVKETLYITGAEFDGFWILMVKNKVYVICSRMIETQVKAYFKDLNIHIKIGIPFYKAVIEILRQNNVDSVLVDTRYISAADFILIEKSLNQERINLIGKVGILDDMRIIKDKDEIEKLKLSCKIVSNVCNTIKSELKPGLTELDIHYRVLELFAKNLVTHSFAPIIASGPNSANPHHRSSNRKISENDVIMLDIGCVYKGYCCDLTRTYFLGTIPDENRRIWDTVKEAQNTVLKELKSGLPICQADKIARKIIDLAGYKDKFIHTTGHGIGIEVHEPPSLALSSEGVFFNNMIVTVEPGIYIEHEFGIRIEDTVLVNNNGCEILTSALY